MANKRYGRQGWWLGGDGGRGGRGGGDVEG